eukprot:TRINITY_DN5760_c0_g3_i2.p2 TRINITY_DN5760_c0_g3~~TRINITY_DN5760_c0_g3_i2.p2  ORF type:complete len:185 (+),score=-7.56 TRINITY_DN5760_c0_g3_i2:132-686(+)
MHFFCNIIFQKIAFQFCNQKQNPRKIHGIQIYKAASHLNVMYFFCNIFFQKIAVKIEDLDKTYKYFYIVACLRCCNNWLGAGLKINILQPNLYLYHEKQIVGILNPLSQPPLPIFFLKTKIKHQIYNHQKQIDNPTQISKLTNSHFFFGQRESKIRSKISKIQQIIRAISKFTHSQIFFFNMLR